MNDSIKDIQRVLLIIADEFDRICKKNNIRYSLIFGSLLGAVRHQGFIPWDDDIDIGMLREEYERFLLACEKDLDKTRFVLQTWDTDQAYVLSYAKIRIKNTYLHESRYEHISLKEHGLFIDIFPYDKVPDNIAVAHIQSLFLFVLYRALLLKGNMDIFKDSTGWKNILKKILKYLIRPISIKTLKCLVGKILVYPKNKTKYVSTNEMISFYKSRMPRHCFDNLKQYDFNDHQFYGPVDFDICLQTTYGKNYMTLPPENKRIWHNEGFDLGPYSNELTK